MLLIFLNFFIALSYCVIPIVFIGTESYSEYERPQICCKIMLYF